MKCRHCGSTLSLPLVDLGSAPPSNAYLTEQTLRAPEKWFPLRVLVCEHCWLVQTEDYAEADELFDADYAYFSSFSTSWLTHAERYVADMVARFGLQADSHVVEVAANDGYLLQYVQGPQHPVHRHRAHRRHGRGRARQGHSGRGGFLRRARWPGSSRRRAGRPT